MNSKKPEVAYIVSTVFILSTVVAQCYLAVWNPRGGLGRQFLLSALVTIGAWLVFALATSMVANRKTAEWMKQPPAPIEVYAPEGYSGPYKTLAPGDTLIIETKAGNWTIKNAYADETPEKEPNEMP